MKRLIIVGALFAAACSVPPGAFKPDQTPIEVVPEASIAEAEEVKPEAKPKVRINLPACKGIDTGDAKESLHLKLDCMLDGK